MSRWFIRRHYHWILFSFLVLALLIQCNVFRVFILYVETTENLEQHQRQHNNDIPKTTTATTRIEEENRSSMVPLQQRRHQQQQKPSFPSYHQDDDVSTRTTTNMNTMTTTTTTIAMMPNETKDLSTMMPQHHHHNNITIIAQSQNHQQQQQLPYFIIHMGPDKTGTTSIQKFLYKHRKMILEKDHYDSTLSRGSNDKDHYGKLTNYFMSCFVVVGNGNGTDDGDNNGTDNYDKTKKKKKRGRNCNPEYWNERLFKLKDIAYFNNNNNKNNNSTTTTTSNNLILSTEDFRWSKDLQYNTAWKEFLLFLTRYFRIRIILVYRRYFEWLPSRYNEEWKGGSGSDGIKVMKWPSVSRIEQQRQNQTAAGVHIDNSNNKNNDNNTTQMVGQVTPSFATFYQWERNGTCVNNNNNNNNNNMADCSLYFANRIVAKTNTMIHPVLEMKTALQESIESLPKLYNNTINSIDIQIINFHSDNLLETFFCNDIIPMAQAACDKAKKIGSNNNNNYNNKKRGKTNKIKNKSSMDTIHFDTIATAAYERGWIPYGLKRNTVKGKIREYLQKEILLRRNSTADTNNTPDYYDYNNYYFLPMTCMTKEMLEEYRRFSYDMEVQLQPSMASSHDEAFSKAVAANEFCNVDTKRLFGESKDDGGDGNTSTTAAGWESFFKSLTPDR